MSVRELGQGEIPPEAENLLLRLAGKMAAESSLLPAGCREVWMAGSAESQEAEATEESAES